MNQFSNTVRSPVVAFGRVSWWNRLNGAAEEGGIKMVGATQKQCSSACPNTTCKCNNATKIKGDLSGRRGR